MILAAGVCILVALQNPSPSPAQAQWIFRGLTSPPSRLDLVLDRVSVVLRTVSHQPSGVGDNGGNRIDASCGELKEGNSCISGGCFAIVKIAGDEAVVGSHCKRNDVCIAELVCLDSRSGR